MANDLNLAILTALAQHSSYLYRLASGEVNKQIGLFDSIMESNVEKIATILRNLNQAERDAMAAGQYNTPRLRRLRDVFTDIKLITAEELLNSFKESAIELAANESAYVAKIAGESATVALEGAAIYKESLKFPVVGGQLVNELFTSLAIATADNVRNNIREGISNGWTNDQILRAIMGSEDLPSEPSVMRSMRIEIERTVRTARSHVSSTAYLETYRAIGYTHVKFLSVIDGRSSFTCANLDQTVWEINDKKIRRPPLHPNCRSTLIGVSADGKSIGRRPFVMDDKPVSKIPKDERDYKIGQLNGNTSFQKFFDERATESFKREWLGEARYKIYKEKGWDISKFVDPLGKKYTLAQLRDLDRKTFEELGL